MTGAHQVHRIQLPRMVGRINRDRPERRERERERERAHIRKWPPRACLSRKRWIRRCGGAVKGMETITGSGNSHGDTRCLCLRRYPGDKISPTPAAASAVEILRGRPWKTIKRGVAAERVALFVSANPWPVLSRLLSARALERFEGASSAIRRLLSRMNDAVFQLALRNGARSDRFIVASPANARKVLHGPPSYCEYVTHKLVSCFSLLILKTVLD